MRHHLNDNNMKSNFITIINANVILLLKNKHLENVHKLRVKTNLARSIIQYNIICSHDSRATITIQR